MSAARGACSRCIDARIATSFSMLQKLPLGHVHPVEFACRRLFVSFLHQESHGHFLHAEQWTTCFKLKAGWHPSASNEYIEWWTKKMEHMKKPVVKELIKKLCYSNLLGLDQTLKNGSCKQGSLNHELLAVKTKYPREVLLCRVGEFYEAVGFDACVLVEYASLNPMAGLRSDTVPRAGCPVMNLRQTLDALTSSGFSVCVYEEVKGPSQGRQRKDRFVSGHAHPGSPYVYGLAEANVDLDIQEEVFVTGISRTSRGYCLVFVSEMMRTYSVEDCLTEEAVVAKLRATTCFQLFLHKSLQIHPSGLHNWREHGDGGLLWAECQSKCYEWFDHDPVPQLLSKVRLLYSIDATEKFREVVFQSTGRPKPLSLGTASQVGIIPTAGVPSILKVLLPADTLGPCYIYLRNLLLNPPTAEIARSIQVVCKLMLQVTSAIPDLICVSASKLVKLINSKEANHLEFSRIRRLASDVLSMHENEQLSPIMEHLLGPVSAITGLEMDCQILIEDCKQLVEQLDNVLAAEDDPRQLCCSVPYIPDDFFHMLESSWKGCVKHELADSYYEEVENSARHLSNMVEKDFVPIVMHIRASDVFLSRAAKAEIIFSRDTDSVCLKLRNVPVSHLHEFGELKPAEDDKGKRVKENLYSTKSVELALKRYQAAALSASSRVYEILRDLSEDLKGCLNTVVYISFFSIVAKTLFAHVSEGARRNWSFPELVDDHQMATPNDLQNTNNKVSVPTLNRQHRLVLEDLRPYWLDMTNSLVVTNTINMNSIHVLTGPNGGGKSSILRAVGAATLLGMCGLMVPCSSAVIPRVDAIMLRMMPQDSPADGKSSFQMEMSELRTILQGVTRKSLVLIDEICRGTEVQKGTAIAGSMIEFLDSSGCVGILSTHLHDLLDMKLDAKNLVFKAMGMSVVNGNLKPTWKVLDGSCRDSLAFETAINEGVAESVIKRARELYELYYSSQQFKLKSSSLAPACCTESNGSFPDYKSSEPESNPDEMNSREWEEVLMQGQVSQKLAKEEPVPAQSEQNLEKISSQRINGNENTNIITATFQEICKQKLSEFQKSCSNSHGGVDGNICFTRVDDREEPPPGVTGYSCVYLMLRPDGRVYIGQTDNISGRIKAHRAKPGLQRAPFLFVRMPNKSIANELETVLLNELPSCGIILVNRGDQSRRHFATKSNLYCNSPF